MSQKPITLEAIAAAEQLFGVVYTDAERRLMLGNLQAQIEFNIRRRRLSLSAEVSPATRFDPRLPGWQKPLSRTFEPGIERTPMPNNVDDMAFAPITQLAGWIRAGGITAERLTGIYLDRIAKYGARLEAIAMALPGVAIEQAQSADQQLSKGNWLGPLHGIPWGCKDIIDTAGILTALGAETHMGRVPESDAAVVTKLAAAGAVLVAKTSVGAFAYGEIWYGGTTRNPWNLDEGSGGSSAGTAAATAAGLIAFGLGTETIGSIVIPSLRCGATGLRPTFGRVSRRGVMPLAWSLDKVGTICRSVEDTALVLAAIEGFDQDDPSSIGVDPTGYLPGVGMAGRRIGFYPADFELEGVDRADHEILTLLPTLGAELVPLRRADLPYDVLMNVVFAEAAAAFEELTLNNGDDQLAWQDAAAWPNIFRKARFLSAIDHIQLDRVRRLAMEDLDLAFARADAILGPALEGPMMLISNFTGNPCLTMRTGFSERETRQRPMIVSGRIEAARKASGDEIKHRVPHGICLYGSIFNEGALVEIGIALERALNVRDERPRL